ncbi:MAG TPA: metalloregulator ArsR/SmtB family transcription factor [Pyrinomonadaceae bacterium]|nr:metalloregulator ArsR/SmtB family transcription factor [Pyrinomonadaceae bacterium]
MNFVVVAAVKIGLGASREEIVQLLRARGRASADELAAALEVSKQCVRKHLDVLERDGYVEHAPERGDRGRPAHLFRLTEKAGELFPRRYDVFAKAVLRQIGEVFGERGLDAVLCGCAEETISRLRPQLEGLAFDARVTRLAELLGEMGYEAEAERLADGSYLLTEWNCPQAELAREYGQLCERELTVYRELLGAEVVRESRIAGGAPRCSYKILRPKKKAGGRA